MIVGRSDWADWNEKVETSYRLRLTWGGDFLLREFKTPQAHKVLADNE